MPLEGIKRGVQNVYTEKEIQHIICEKRSAGASLRQIAHEYPGLNYADIQRASKGIFPRSATKRQIFELPDFARVLAIDNEIPDGSQVLKASHCIECNQPFVSNHPRRRKCFLCSPYRGKH
jgi:hypothetical protein